MDLEYILKGLEKNLDTILSLTQKLSGQEIRFKKINTDWNILEIICHLIDEEKMDFRLRLQTVLTSPYKHPPIIDPESWPKLHQYDTQDFQIKLAEFQTERKTSLTYLRSLKDPKLTNYYEHPALGNLDGNHFLRNWLAHDYLHIRQITFRKYQFLKNSFGDISYAGIW